MLNKNETLKTIDKIIKLFEKEADIYFKSYSIFPNEEDAEKYDEYQYYAYTMKEIAEYLKEQKLDAKETTNVIKDTVYNYTDIGSCYVRDEDVNKSVREVIEYAKRRREGC